MNPSNADLSPRSRWSGRRVPIAALVVAAATSALLAAGCGGGSSGAGVAQLGTTTSTSDSSSSGGSGKGDPAAFSACMRKNGVPNFPDPDRSGQFRITGGQDKSGRFGVDTNAPQFSKARQACRRLEPNGGKPDPQEVARMQQQALKFSQCMRAHGVPKFPDPQFRSGGGTLMKIGKDVNPDSRQFQAAQKACQKLLPGAVQGAPPGEKP
jgi:hypothetical protein